MPLFVGRPRRLKNSERHRLIEVALGRRTPRPVSLAASKPKKQGRLITGQRRQQIVDYVVALLRTGRPTLFAFQATITHSLRSSFVLEGAGWERSQIEAEQIVGEALRRLGAQLPRWIEGQKEALVPRDRCIRCGGELDFDGSDYHTALYCSELCRDAHRLRRDSLFAEREVAVYRGAIGIIARKRWPIADCEVCGELRRGKQDENSASIWMRTPGGRNEGRA